MMAQRPSLETRIVSALESSPARIPVLLGGCGSGRTAVLLGLRERLGSASSQYVDVERIATTPERFLRSLVDASPFGSEGATPSPATAREAFNAAVDFLSTARRSQAAVTFLLDEVLELRTFESFPGLRTVLKDLMAALPLSGNRFVLSTRYVNRARRLLEPINGAFDLIPMPALNQSEVRATMDGPSPQHGDERDREDLARAVHALADGRPGYVRTVVDTMRAMDQGGGSDPISALSALLAPGGQLYASCRFSYELRLHRARGYGALKAILDVLADQEPLTLTQIAQRIMRTPGSTKDYLSWLEDVDLITVKQKKYSYSDPVLRLWVRLHCSAAPPTDEDLAREVHMYALARLPQHPQTARVFAGAGKAAQLAIDDRSKWGIIEID